MRISGSNCEHVSRGKSFRRLAEEGRGGEDGCHALDLRDAWKMGCSKGARWESEGEAWSEDESVSSGGSREGNVCNALHVIGLHGPGDKISLFLDGLGAGKGGSELRHGPGHAVPGNARGPVVGCCY